MACPIAIIQSEWNVFQLEQLWTFCLMRGQCWSRFTTLYNAGFVGAIVCFAVGLGFNAWGMRRAGSPAMIHIHGNTGTIHPEVPAEAQGFVGKLVGMLAKLIGVVLVIEGFLAGTMLLFHMK